MLNRFVQAVVALALVAPALPGQSYEITLKKSSAKGDTQEVKEIDSQVGLNKVFDPKGSLLNEEKPATKKVLEYTVTILEGGDRRPAKYKETYAQAVLESGKKSVNLPMRGRTLVYELTNGRYQVKAEGEPALTDQDLAPFVTKANEKEEDDLDALFLPGKKVKVGESWVIESKKVVAMLARALGAEFDADSARVTGKLAKAYKKDKQQWGTLEMTVKLTVKSSGPWKLDPPGEFNFTVVLDTAIDASSSSGTMKMVGDMTAKTTLEQLGRKLTIDTRTDLTKDKTVVEKK